MLFTGGDPLYVWGDEFKVEEVITNYLTNALNHLDYDHTIEISCKKEGNVVKTTVFNTGDPIPEEDLDKVWVKFFKVDKARTREYGGSCLLYTSVWCACFFVKKLSKAFKSQKDRMTKVSQM